ncbi:chaperonin 10-like protein [Crepidotus variabilis]|uniref:Chaperonin 10-like protein n=1 Tax=Crepidotus variabilis TaxID=179855 RepID=A0A9P6JRR9_9AGAR|nr:chaperonin 10-like protein [Crepidotus variabilis]
MSLPTTPSAILYAPTDIRIEDRPIWAPSPTSVQIAVAATGLCGSDLHYYSAGRNGDFAVRAPLVLGHEAAGTIVALGSSVNSPGVNASDDSQLRVGMRVAIEAGVYCRNELGDCEYCAVGRYNLCKKMRFASSASRFPHLDGTLTGRMNHPAFVVHPLPDNVSFEQAALAEPLSVLIHASRRCGLSTWRASHPSYAFTSPGTVEPTVASSSGSGSGLCRPHPYPAPIPLSSSPSPSSSNNNTTQTHPKGPTVLVFGVGAIGLLACLLAKYHGASRVCAVDINEKRLEWARREGFCDEVFCVPSSDKERQQQGDGCCAAPPSVSASATPKPQTQAQPSSTDPMKASQQLSSSILSSFSPPTSTTSPFLGFSYTFECTGHPSSIASSILCTAPGGKVCLIGMGARNMMMPVSQAATREVDLVGVFRYAGCYGDALRVLGSAEVVGLAGTVGEMVLKLVTHRFGLEDTKKAFELLRKGEDEDGGLVLKVMIGSGEA